MNRTDNLRAAGFVCLAIGLWAAGDLMVKLLTARMTVPELMFLRGLVTVAFAYALGRASGWRPSLRTILHPAVLLRGFVEVLVVVFCLTGIQNLPIGIANTLVFTSPVFGVILGGLLQGERLTAARLGAVAIGFVGMLLVTNPIGAQASIWLLFPLIGAFLQAVGDLMTRRIDPAIPTEAITFTTVAMITAGGGVLTMGSPRLPQSGDLWMLLVCAVLMTSAYRCYLQAFRIGEMSFAAPFKYLSIPLMLLLGWIFWGDVPTGWMGLGAGLIVLAGLLVIWQDRPARTTPLPATIPE